MFANFSQMACRLLFTRAKRYPKRDPMRLTAVASAIFAFAGNTPGVMPFHIVFSAPEPIWLVLWGIALLTLSRKPATGRRLNTSDRLEVVRRSLPHTA